MLDQSSSFLRDEKLREINAEAKARCPTHIIERRNQASFGRIVH
jgi:hypothetical protein